MSKAYLLESTLNKNVDHRCQTYREQVDSLHSFSTATPLKALLDLLLLLRLLLLVTEYILLKKKVQSIYDSFQIKLQIQTTVLSITCIMPNQPVVCSYPEDLGLEN